MKFSRRSTYELILPTQKAIEVRAWEKAHLPIEQSALALDLFLVIAYNTLCDRPLTLKLLFCSIDFSEAGIRKHLRRMLAEGSAYRCYTTPAELDVMREAQRGICIDGLHRFTRSVSTLAR